MLAMLRAGAFALLLCAAPALGGAHAESADGDLAFLLQRPASQEQPGKLASSAEQVEPATGGTTAQPAKQAGAPRAGNAGYGMGRMGMMMGGGFSFSMIFMIIVIGMAGSVMAAGGTCFWGVWSFVSSFIVAEVDIECKSEAHKWLELWISQCPELEERSSKWRMALARELGPQQAAGNRAKAAAEAAHQDNEPCFLPRDGESTRITFRGWWLWIKLGAQKEGAQNQNNQGMMGMGGGAGTDDKVIRITSPFRNKQKIIELLKEASQLYTDKLKTHTLIWAVAGGAARCRWRVLDARPSRPLDTVILEGSSAQDVCQDVQRFLKGESWYAARGVPYRRGYLLYGPPGCGKTSFITALAGELHLVICIINLASRELTDDSLLELFSEAPRHSILLLEDVDAAFRQEQQAATPSPEQQQMPTVGARNVRGVQGAGVTFSGVLNAIDGVAAQEGKVLFLTTNHPEKLDEALVRPGRVDVRVNFELASKETARRLFMRFYKDTPLEGLKEGEVWEEVLQGLAQDFAERLPEMKISPASIQGLLMDHRDDPRVALKHVDRLLPVHCEGDAGAGTEKTVKPKKEKEDEARTALASRKDDVEVVPEVSK